MKSYSFFFFREKREAGHDGSHAWNHTSWVAGSSRVWGRSELHNETLSQEDNVLRDLGLITRAMREERYVIEKAEDPRQGGLIQDCTHWWSLRSPGYLFSPESISFPCLRSPEHIWRTPVLVWDVTAPTYAALLFPQLQEHWGSSLTYNIPPP